MPNKIYREEPERKAATQKQVPDEVKFLLEGHVYCGECDSLLHGTSGTDESGNACYYYTCPNHRKHQCNMADQPKDKIESGARYFFDDRIHELDWRILITPFLFIQYKKENSDQVAYRDSLENNLKHVERKLDDLVKSTDEDISEVAIQRPVMELEGQKRLLELQIAVEEQKDEIMYNRFSWFYEGMIGDFDDEELRQYIFDHLVDKIYLYEDKMIITFQISDDTQELYYEEILKKIEMDKCLMEFWGSL